MKGEGGDRLTFSYAFKVAVEEKGLPPNTLSPPIKDEKYEKLDQVLKESEKDVPGVKMMMDTMRTHATEHEPEMTVESAQTRQKLFEEKEQIDNK
ncbi:hypothetical protein O9G_003380 [Rozella allomycis CSF55]|uniref:Uncharacterized protein n=1 Tax=Rozella allomycis (strain CSF55) TaxID=988480 RepID=A0A075B3N0_ROZAC|nr:hypothetical protein O9G_003380 [Rozella allomycis CSF55]|eukprot:EPZ35488.1 hypothetical protein O9G_003380 [Rozella allomycis CSF55]